MPYKDVEKRMAYSREYYKAHKSERKYHPGPKTIHAVCPNCGKDRWVTKYGWERKRTNGLCKDCAIRLRAPVRKPKYGKEAPGWKGGRTKVYGGYIKIFVTKDNFFYSMADKTNYVMEHRLIMAKSLGRCLHRWEIVHHINHIRDDNRIENLQLVTDDRHKQITILERRINYLEKRVTLLEAENIGLRTSVF